MSDPPAMTVRLFDWTLLLGLLGWTLLCANLVAGQLRACAGEAKWESIKLFTAGSLAVAVCLLCRTPADAASRAVALSMLVVTGIADARSGYIFDAATRPAALLCIAAAMATQRTGAPSIALLAITAPLALAALVSRGSWIGWGDVKASFSLAIAFGLFESSIALFSASLTGLIQASFDKARGVRLGPHLAAGALLATIFGPAAQRIFMEGWR